jgi:uncharacterized membrane protein YgdD (TMEM256/DUF423 family)
MRFASERLWFALGALFAGLGVAAGAFGAHALKRVLAVEQLAIFETAVRYQMLHALALLAVAWAVSRWPRRPVGVAGVLFVSGIALFSGSLYLLVFTGAKFFALLTPVGGLALILGWAWLVFAVVRSSKSGDED